MNYFSSNYALPIGVKSRINRFIKYMHQEDSDLFVFKAANEVIDQFPKVL